MLAKNNYLFEITCLLGKVIEHFLNAYKFHNKGKLRSDETARAILRVQVEHVSKVANNFHLAINELLPKNLSANR